MGRKAKVQDAPAAQANGDSAPAAPGLLDMLSTLAGGIIEAEFPGLHLDSLKVVYRQKGQNSFELKQRHGKILLTLALPVGKGATDFPALVRRAARTAQQLDSRRVYVPAKILAKLFENAQLSESERAEVSKLLYGEKNFDAGAGHAASQAAARAAADDTAAMIEAENAKLASIVAPSGKEKKNA